MNEVKAAFEDQVVEVALDALLPLKSVPASVRKSSKYRQIASSVAAVGVIEPLVVARSKDGAGKFVLLDGHLRHAILVDADATVVRCLVSTDDEAFTYNKRINRLATIQEHLMIVRAIERGVSEDRLAKALNLDVRAIRRRRLMLVGIAPEVVDLLKDRSVNPNTFAVLRKMRPMRQIEAAELMTSAGNFTASYAKAILAATRQSDLVKSHKPKKINGLTSEQMARMEREMETLQQNVRGIETGYSDDVLHLVIIGGYLARLLKNVAVHRYLDKRHTDLLKNFESIVAASSIEDDISVNASGLVANPASA